MKVLSVNVGRARTIESGRSERKTGIWKGPVADVVRVGPDGLEDDAVCDRRHHGGPDQAVYVYGQPDYDWWTRTLGRVVEPGTFGENLTLSDLETARARVGDRLTIGSVVLEVTAPRIPCGTLASRMKDASFAVRFRAAERPGFYCRVIVPGGIRTGDPVAYVSFDGDTVSVLDMFRDYYEPATDEATIRRYLAAPIAQRNRARKQKDLAEVTAHVGSDPS